MTFASGGFETSLLTVHLARYEELEERVPICISGDGFLAAGRVSDQEDVDLVAVNWALQSVCNLIAQHP